MRTKKPSREHVESGEESPPDNPEREPIRRPAGIGSSRTSRPRSPRSAIENKAEAKRQQRYLRHRPHGRLPGGLSVLPRAPRRFIRARDASCSTRRPPIAWPASWPC